MNNSHFVKRLSAREKLVYAYASCAHFYIYDIVPDALQMARETLLSVMPGSSMSNTSEGDQSKCVNVFVRTK